MNAITWMLNPPSPRAITAQRTVHHRIEVPEDLMLLDGEDQPPRLPRNELAAERRDAVLRILLQGEEIAARELGARIGVKRTSVIRYIEELRTKGHVIYGTHGCGFRYGGKAK